MELMKALSDKSKMELIDHLKTGTSGTGGGKGRSIFYNVLLKARRFELDRQCFEKEANLISADFYDGFCMLRRELILRKTLKRDHEIYWKEKPDQRE